MIGFKRFMVEADEREDDVGIIVKIGTKDDEELAEEIVSTFLPDDATKARTRKLAVASGAKLTNEKERSYDPGAVLDTDGLNDIIDGVEGGVVITYAGGVKKLRAAGGNTKIGSWKPLEKGDKLDVARNKKLQSVLMMYFMVKDRSIELVEKSAAGIKPELMQVATLNKFFEDNNIRAPLALSIDGEDTGVSIDGALKVPGDQKSDIALTSAGREVFWISYKHAEYAGDISVKNINFQQYGSSKRLYDREYANDFRAALEGMFSSFADSIGNADESVAIVRQVVNGKVKLSKDEVAALSTMTIKFPVDGLAKKLSENKSVREVVFPMREVYQDFMKSDDEMTRDIALKSIYGLDYGRGNGFGQNNVNVLLQTNKPVKVSLVMDDDDDEAVGIDIAFEESSHIVFNPDMPFIDRETSAYLPVIYLRKDSSPGNWFNTNTTLFAGRVMIFPRGKVSSKGAEV